MQLKRLFFIPDTHRPFHDKTAWAVAMKSARHFKPHRVIVLGDFVDCYSISDHDKDPARSGRLVEEIADANLGLDEIDSLGAKEKDFLGGNHEDRLNRLISKLPALHGLPGFSMPELLRLRARGWTYTPYRKHRKIGKLYATHDCGDAGPNAHVRAGAVFEHSAIIGHTHRLATHYWGNAAAETHVAAMLGWLGKSVEQGWEHDIRRTRNWQHGFGLGWMEPSGNVHIQAVPIVNGKAIVNGKLIHA